MFPILTDNKELECDQLVILASEAEGHFLNAQEGSISRMSQED